MSESAHHIRRRIIYHGRVQGVGFRYTTCSVAKDFAVTGFVKNLRDGTVELVAEGSRSNLDGFLAAVAQAMRGNIESNDIEESPATGEFTRFDVGY